VGRLGASLVVAAALAACAPRARAPAPSDDGGFVYGFLEVPPALGPPSCVALIEADHDPVAGGRHGCMATSPDGLFWQEDLRPIRWVVDGVQVGGTFHRLASPAPFAVAPRALHFWGSARLAPGIDGKGAALTAAPAPTRAELLERLLAKEGISPRWRERIEEQLRQGD
jgi:hypothetical protein